MTGPLLVPRSPAGAWMFRQRTRVAKRRHRDLGEISVEYFLATRLRRGDLAFDIGANHAAYAKAMYRLGARVVAVEPQEDLVVEMRGLLPRVTVVAAAVGARPGTATLTRVNEADQMATIEPGWLQECPVPLTRASEEEVSVTTLDALIAEYGVPEFIKIDVEGSDHHVLHGLSVAVNQLTVEINSTTPRATIIVFERLAELGRYEFFAAPIDSLLYRPITGSRDAIEWMEREGSHELRALDLYARLLRR